MTAKELKELLQNVPDDWKVVVEQPEGDTYFTEGAYLNQPKRELVIQM